eukprot:CAMPEP_0174341966 /NCGR_PEP_ID=MMETSP0810-20121108/25814_1 /TAXON_ID=73025 ORGANISM="Eutreptiella gymnastica-like, Strain CCMP1594" /NCGR_SAMPLE_ID=MMETSP0810 /ASSEMBLY_ACC=CAM_ASM_000659 /LENGTH=82 /DNA_ID=CAMNT_0015463879 /DNA_START=198 /DNA_END=443 /DNA_ORIENTATION=-
MRGAQETQQISRVSILEGGKANAARDTRFDDALHADLRQQYDGVRDFGERISSKCPLLLTFGLATRETHKKGAAVDGTGAGA